MATFLQLKNRIASRLSTASATQATEIGDAINSAIGFFEEKHFWFNEALATIPLTIDNEAVPSVPSDFLYEFQDGGLVIVENKLRYTLDKITHSERAAINSETTARPRFYTFRLDALITYPIPDKAYSLELYYIKSYIDLVADGDSNDWTNNAERLIEAKALSDLYLDQRHSLEMYAIYDDRVKKELAALQSKNKQNLGTGRLTVQSLNYGKGRRASKLYLL